MNAKTKWILPASICLLLVTPLISTKLNPNNYKEGRSRDEQARLERNSSAVAQLFGELRSSMSDIVYLKTERYLHGGIAYSSHLNVAKSVQQETQEYTEHELEVGEEHYEGDGHDHGNDDAGTATLIPTSNQDYRGFIGDFERQVRPWLDPSVPHVHSSGKELLPWYRIMTLSDPQSVRGYMIGSYWLLNANKFDEAYEFITEGIQNNPDDFQLPLYRARILMNKIHYTKDRSAPGEEPMSPEELEMKEQMLQDYLNSAEMVIKYRPEVYDMRNFNPNWTDYMEDDAGAALRLTVTILKREKRYQQALELAKRGAGRLNFYDAEGNYYSEDPKLQTYIAELNKIISTQ